MDAFFERLKASLHEHPSPSLESGGMVLKDASVLAPLFLRGGEPFALLTMRPETLRKHPGQVAFPGGGREPQDVTPLHTALREAHEELGIPPEAVEVLGMLGTMPTITSFFVTPFVGVVADGLPLTPSPTEIQEVLEVPLLRVRIEKRRAYEADRDAFVWEGSQRFIWGATFRMMTQLLEHVRRAAR
ncbi:MAG: CoA pyrophosphatase [Myxococcaceae bacterium]|nr:CoA pyrophosphatase [Myxococcaceae bacterium]